MVAKQEENVKQFRTVRQIMEHYLPEEEPLITDEAAGKELGKRLAQQLLADFRKTLRA